VDLIRFRQLQQRDYRDPADFLKGLRAVELGQLAQVNDPLVRRLRSRDLREWREARIAALFCHGYGERIGQKIYFSKGEFEDADCVAHWNNGEEPRFAPIQIKEVAPNDLNGDATIQDVVDGLIKYSGANDLTVLIYLNRKERFRPSEFLVPAGARIAALWVMACINPDQSRWALWGNYMEQPERSEFAYPT
jgi:hypothetical protein